MEDVKVTPELMYRYQVAERSLDEVLENDRVTLKNMHQVGF